MTCPVCRSTAYVVDLYNCTVDLKECPICLQESEKEDTLSKNCIVLCCGHCFHSDCIKKCSGFDHILKHRSQFNSIQDNDYGPPFKFLNVFIIN